MGTALQEGKKSNSRNHSTKGRTKSRKASTSPTLGELQVRAACTGKGSLAPHAILGCATCCCGRRKPESKRGLMPLAALRCFLPLLQGSCHCLSVRCVRDAGRAAGRSVVTRGPERARPAAVPELRWVASRLKEKRRTALAVRLHLGGERRGSFSGNKICKNPIALACFHTAEQGGSGHLLMRTLRLGGCINIIFRCDNIEHSSSLKRTRPPH